MKNPILEAVELRSEVDRRVTVYVPPVRVLWQTEGGSVQNVQALLAPQAGQITLHPHEAACVLDNRGGPAAVLLDFGAELQGGLQLLAWKCRGKAKRSARVRVRFGESAMEAMNDIGGERNATNDHTPRDLTAEISSLGTVELGSTGFRFARIDLLGRRGLLELKAVRAVFSYQDTPYQGSFRCSDPLLERIWQTAAYTVQLNMQNYLWDGIKRDRLVWIGDMHPETSTIQAVFGSDPIVPRSLDFVRDDTPLPGWMNGIPTYSMWWVLIQAGWYRQNGDLAYLDEQRAYLLALLEQLASCIDADGNNTTPTFRFMDWPSSSNRQAVDAGIQALHVLALETGAELCTALGESAAAAAARAAADRLKAHPLDPNGSKQAAALQVLAGLADPAAANRAVLAPGGARGLSTFLGYYVLRARALAGDIQGCLEAMRAYWGGMLALGATSFWEDFDLAWLENAARIDELTPPGQVDVHGSYGGYCYIGYRHSLCHGWSSGPVPWLAEFVLGIQPLEPGCRVVRLAPTLGDLEWAEGSYPTPHGLIRLRHEKQANGQVRTVLLEKPDEVSIVL